MLTFGEFAKFLGASAARVRPALVLETHHLMSEVEKDAKALIGVEQPEWAPLSPVTIADKAAKGYAVPKPLLRTGEMRDSIESQAQATGTGAEGAVGSNSAVALWQEMGTVSPHPIPPRPFMGLAMMKVEPRAKEEFGALAVELLTPGVR